MGKKLHGFTVVELLIVVVVVAVLAAVIVVSYSGIQKRAQQSAVSSDLQSGMKKVMAFSILSGIMPTSSQMESDSSLKFSLSPSLYKSFTYCANTMQAALGAELQSGDKYYIQSGQNVNQDNTVAVDGVCAKLGIVNQDSSAVAVAYLYGDWVFCSNENGTCSFSGTRTVRYGANNQYNYRYAVTSSISCTNAVFGDPISGTAKQCYYR